MYPNVVLPCLDRLFQIIVPQWRHYKFGFVNGGIIDVMTSD